MKISKLLCAGLLCVAIANQDHAFSLRPLTAACRRTAMCLRFKMTPKRKLAAILTAEVAIIAVCLGIVAYVDRKNWMPKMGEEFLTWGVEHKSERFLRWAIKLGANINKNDRKVFWDRKSGKGLLHKAATDNNADLVRLLLKVGADVDAKDVNGFTALTHAIIHGNTAIALQLIGAKANVNSEAAYGVTPLQSACHAKNLSLVESLVKNGAHINHRDNLRGWAPLHYASYGKCNKIVDFLCKNHADLDVSCNEGGTPLLLSVYCGNVGACEILINSGASLEARLKDGKGIDELTSNHKILNLVAQARQARRVHVDEPQDGPSAGGQSTGNYAGVD